MECAAKIRGLKKVYSSGIRGRGIVALDGVDLEIGEGEVFGLIGPNGAGKSTTIKILLGLCKPSGGVCEVFGEPPSKFTRSKIGYLPESPFFYGFLTARELVEFYAKLCGLGSKTSREAAAEALQTVGLAGVADRKISTYSKGMTQRAGIAQAIVHNPSFVILDEPASGLDPLGADAVAEIVSGLKARGKTVLLCSHMMGEVEKLCSRVAVLAAGKIAAQGALDSILKNGSIVCAEFSNLSQTALEAVREAAKKNGATLEKHYPSKIPLEQFFKQAVEKNK